MKKLLLAILGFFSLIALNSCLKDKGFENQEYGLKEGGILDEPFVQILGGGTAKFGDQIIKPDATDPSNTADTAEFKVFYVNNGKPADRDIKITLAVDPASIIGYNNTPGNTKFEILPASNFSFTKTTVTVKAGQSFSEPTYFIYNPQLIDPSKLYMVPIRIVDAQGVKISSNNATIFYHIIGNPLAGNYSLVGTRYNYSGSVSWAGFPAAIPPFTGTINLTAAFPTKVASAIDGQTIALDFSNLGGNGFAYLITGNADFSKVTLSYNDEVLSGNVIKYSILKDYSFIGAGTATSPKPTFRILTHYNNAASGAGNDRILDELFTHQ